VLATGGARARTNKRNCRRSTDDGTGCGGALLSVVEDKLPVVFARNKRFATIDRAGPPTTPASLHIHFPQHRMSVKQTQVSPVRSGLTYRPLLICRSTIYQSCVRLLQRWVGMRRFGRQTNNLTCEAETRTHTTPRGFVLSALVRRCQVKR
jgi:hypothetical protein